MESNEINDFKTDRFLNCPVDIKIMKKKNAQYFEYVVAVVDK